MTRFLQIAAVMVAALASGNSALAGQYRVKDLGTLGGTSSLAFAINNLGQIVGRGFTLNGEFHAFLASPVPEPPSLITGASGGVAVLIPSLAGSLRSLG